jgi:phage/plasmid-like protein (TIGR03299 family)
MTTETKMLVEGVTRPVPTSRLGVTTLGVSSVEEALAMSNLDWQVKKSDEPVRATIVSDDGIEDVACADKFITYRQLPNEAPQALGVVGKSYEVIQNSEAFSFLNYLADDSGATFASAGSLKGGRQVFVNMKMPSSLAFANGTDSVDMYLMVTTSHDGTKAFTAAVTPVRLVCTNQISFALRSAKAKFTLRHTRTSSGKVAEAHNALGLVRVYEDAFQDAVNNLLDQEMTKNDFSKFVDTLMPDRFKADSTDVTNSVVNAKNDLMNLWEAPTQQIVGGTKWAAYNAVAEWADWFKPIRTSGDADLARAERIVTGQGDNFKNQAYALLTR